MKNILIRPGAPSLAKNKQFEINDKKLNLNNSLDPSYYLREFLKKKGYSLDTMDMGDLKKCDAIIFPDIEFFDDDLKQCVKLGLRDKMYLILYESKLIKPHQYCKRKHKLFKAIFTWDDALVDNKKYFKFYWPQLILDKPIKKISFEKRKFMCMINGNKYAIAAGELYSERKKAVLFFEKRTKELDVFGPGWNKNQFRRITFLHTAKNLHKLSIKRILYLIDYIFNIRKISCYRGFAENSVKDTAKYKYCICYENSKAYPGYITEKIFNCFNARCVPIYWGAPDIEKYVPKGTFIDRRDFKNYKELDNYLKKIDKKEYEKYIKKIEEFLKSDKAKLFSYDNFNNTIFQVLKKTGK